MTYPNILYLLSYKVGQSEQSKQQSFLTATRFLYFMPQNIFQLLNPTSYYLHSKKNDSSEGYEIVPIREDFIEEVLKQNIHDFVIIFSHFDAIFSASSIIRNFQEKFSVLHFIDLELLQKYFDDQENGELESFRKTIIQKIRKSRSFKQIKELTGQEAFSLPKGYSEFNIYDRFVPNLPNFLTLSQIIGSIWLFDSQIITKEIDLSPISEHTKQRNQQILEKCIKIDRMLYSLYTMGKAEIINKLNPFLDSLILVAPFHNPRQINKSKIPNTELDKLRYKFLTVEQDQNYIYNIHSSVSITQKELEEISQQFIPLLTLKTHKLDLFSYLNSSFKYSPIIRLPLIGKSMNKELSFTRPEYFREKKSLYKRIQKVGNRLEKLLMFDNLKEYLTNRNGQIFVISDLPLEWMHIDGVPISMTHDICRLPEPKNIVDSYFRLKFKNFIIKDEILLNTLIILGVSQKEGVDEDFKTLFTLIENQSHAYGYQTRRCQSIFEISEVVKKMRPEILVFDCHGGYDEESLSSYLCIGEEKLTPEKIYEHQISAPIIILSACNTVPNYGYTNSAL